MIWEIFFFFARAPSMRFNYLDDVFCFAIFLSGQDDFMNFIIMFMEKMVEVLNYWMP